MEIKLAAGLCGLQGFIKLEYQNPHFLILAGVRAAEND
jgi:hypothetical protein